MDPRKENLRIQKWVVFTALLLFAIKIVAYFLTFSVAILTDALESTVNVIAGALGWYSLYVAAKPRDIDHPYGHGKAEFISAAVEGTLVLSAGAIIVYNAIKNIIIPQVISSIDTGIMLVGITAILNWALGFVAYKKGKKTGSLALQASGKHLQTDSYSTVGIIIGLVLISFTGYVWIDSVVAIGFGFFIIYTGYK